jgi:pimeloyl-ACP methyl ester carboxylesterase
MKENAEFSCNTGRGGDLLVTALQNLVQIWGEALEIHLVGHSAGAIIVGHLLDVLAARGLEARVASIHLHAPACTVEFANRHYAPHEPLMKRLYLDILSDAAERDDTVGEVYRKSLLYLVSNALEPDLRTPLLGLANVRDPDYRAWDGSSSTGEALGNWRSAAALAGLDARTKEIAPGKVPVWKPADAGQPSAVARVSHGSFDNNIEVMARTLGRITGQQLVMPVDDLRGF